jgi:phage terminase large subunit-like protein
MKEYYQYIEGVRTGRIVASQYIKQAVERLENLKQRPDIFFDEAAVQECFDFISCMKHFAGKSAGKPFILLPYQK